MSFDTCGRGGKYIKIVLFEIGEGLRPELETKGI